MDERSPEDERVGGQVVGDAWAVDREAVRYRTRETVT
jgi:hypothetical protein